ncbi:MULTISPECIES: class I adenylate-forming enzyme family protein [Bacillaceae]|nr:MULTISPECIES: class I adenylate-forming enzyme family protein [Bacillaceae]MCF2647080.1 acyl--CoA ligase [Niallia circulans]CAI9392961.1 Long-chain-fatty-acid--CoA ligase [Bacillus sp. T2.9-1]
MISGNDYWSNEIKDPLRKQLFLNKEYYSFQTISDNMYKVVKENASNSPDKIAIIDTDGSTYTYFDIQKKVEQLASYLVMKYGMKKGSHIGILLFNSVEFVVVFLAAQKLGATIIPFPTKYKEKEIISLIENSDCDLIIADEEYSHWISKYEEIYNRTFLCKTKNDRNHYGFTFTEAYPLIETYETGNLEDIAIIMFTSGTTSNCKGAVIRNFNIQHAINAYVRIFELTDKDSSILATPMYNITGLVGILSVVLKCKGTLYLQKLFKAENVLEQMQKNNITFLHSSPTVLTMLMSEKRRFPHLPELRTIACGSSNMAIEKIKELKKWLPQMSFRTIYGLTETTSPGTISPTDVSTSPYIGSSGHPIPGLFIKIINDNGKEAAVGEKGEVWIKGTNVIEEYYNQNSTLITADKWLRTGDIGYINSTGYLYIVDRIKDLINRGGEKIYTFDVENAIYQIEGIKEVAVVGVKDNLYGEIPVAILCVEEGFMIDEIMLKTNLKEKLASYEIPVKYFFVKEIDKTPNGKIDKKKIRKNLESTRERG